MNSGTFKSVPVGFRGFDERSMGFSRGFICVPGIYKKVIGGFRYFQMRFGSFQGVSGTFHEVSRQFQSVTVSFKRFHFGCTRVKQTTLKPTLVLETVIQLPA